MNGGQGTGRYGYLGFFSGEEPFKGLISLSEKKFRKHFLGQANNNELGVRTVDAHPQFAIKHDPAIAVPLSLLHATAIRWVAVWLYMHTINRYVLPSLPSCHRNPDDDSQTLALYLLQLTFSGCNGLTSSDK